MYKNLPDRIITIALESVDYSKDQACIILNTLQHDDKFKPKANTVAANRITKISK